MKIQILSDLHLDPDNPYEIQQSDADLVVLAGDIDRGSAGIEWAAAQSENLNKPFIYVAGDHEFHDQERREQIAKLEAFSQDHPGVTFLENDAVEIDGIRFLGTTLWYSAQGANEKRGKRQLEQRLDEFQAIREGAKLLTLTELIEIHQQSLQWLEAEFTKPFTGKTVVITHHAPTLHSWPWTWIRNGGGSAPNWARPAYCTDLEWLLKKYQPDIWIHGHVHSACEYQVDDTRVYCNPHGYEPGEARGFEDIKLVQV